VLLVLLNVAGVVSFFHYYPCVSHFSGLNFNKESKKERKF
jgi:hypothetical protein